MCMLCPSVWTPKVVNKLKRCDSVILSTGPTGSYSWPQKSSSFLFSSSQMIQMCLDWFCGCCLVSRVKVSVNFVLCRCGCSWGCLSTTMGAFSCWFKPATSGCDDVDVCTELISKVQVSIHLEACCVLWASEIFMVPIEHFEDRHSPTWYKVQFLAQIVTKVYKCTQK